MSPKPQMLESAEQFLEKNRKKRRFGLVEILIGAVGVAESLAIMTLDPFAEMISTPGIEHYVGGIANGILAYGVGAVGLFVLGKGLYDIIEYTAGIVSAERQLEATKDKLRSQNQGTRRGPTRDTKSRQLYNPKDLNKLRTKRRIDPLLL